MVRCHLYLASATNGAIDGMAVSVVDASTGVITTIGNLPGASAVTTTPDGAHRRQPRWKSGLCRRRLRPHGHRYVIERRGQFPEAPRNQVSTYSYASVNASYATAESAGKQPLIANRTAVGSWEKLRGPCF